VILCVLLMSADILHIFTFAMVSVVWFSYYSCGIILFTWEVYEYAAIRNETVVLMGPINEIFTASISIRGNAPGTLSVCILTER
jgi:hypothetical protein